MGRTPCCEKNGLKKGPWTPEEDQKLIDYIQRHGHGNWRALPKRAELLRCGKSCRLRWTNYLRPDIKRGNFSFEEDHTIIQLHALLGNKWSAIAASLPGRTDNEIKNYWNTHLKKRLLQMGIDPVTHRPRMDILGFSDMQTPFVPSGLSYHMMQLESARLEESLKLVAGHEIANIAESDNGNSFRMSSRHQLGNTVNKCTVNSLADLAWAPQLAIANLDSNGLIPQDLGEVVQPKKIDAESLANQINVNSYLLIQDEQGPVRCFLDNMCSLGFGKSSSKSFHIDDDHHAAAVSSMGGIQLEMKKEVITQGHERTPNGKPCETKMNAPPSTRISHENPMMVSADINMVHPNVALEVPIQQAGNSYERAILPELMLKFAENSSVEQTAVTIGLGNSTSAEAGTPWSSDIGPHDGKDYWRIMLKSVGTRPSDLSSVSSAIS